MSPPAVGGGACCESHSGYTAEEFGENFQDHAPETGGTFRTQVVRTMQSKLQQKTLLGEAKEMGLPDMFPNNRNHGLGAFERSVLD